MRGAGAEGSEIPGSAGLVNTRAPKRELGARQTSASKLCSPVGKAYARLGSPPASVFSTLTEHTFITSTQS